MPGKVQDTTGYDIFKLFPVGEINLPAGEQTLQVKPNGKGGAELMHLERVRLIPL